MNRRLIIKILFSLLGVCILGEGLLIYFAYNQYHTIKTDPIKVLSQNKGGHLPKNEEPGKTPGASPSPSMERINIDGKEYIKKPDVVNILFCGVDYMSSRAERNLGERSDMIMVCAIDPDDKKATLVSIPRDTRAMVSKIDVNTGKVTGTEYNKINAAFSFGGGTKHYSYQNTIETVEKLLNLDGKFDMTINYYTGLNVDGVPHIADAVGGVTVTLADDFPGIGSKGKTVTLTGQKSIDFIRERKEVGGDLGRVSHQQQFMLALATKIQKMGAVDSITRLYDKLTKYVDTNLNTDEMVAFALILDKLNVKNIEHITLQGTWKSPFIWPDEESLKETMLKIYYKQA